MQEKEKRAKTAVGKLYNKDLNVNQNVCDKTEKNIGDLIH